MRNKFSPIFENLASVLNSIDLMVKNKRGFNDSEFDKLMKELGEKTGYVYTWSNNEDIETGNVSSKKKRKVKMDKKSVQIRKIGSPFMFYSKEVYSQVKGENPCLSSPEIAKLIGMKWRSLSNQEKEQYSKQYQDAKQKILMSEEAVQNNSDVNSV